MVAPAAFEVHRGEVAGEPARPGHARGGMQPERPRVAAKSVAGASATTETTHEMASFIVATSLIPLSIALACRTCSATRHPLRA